MIFPGNHRNGLVRQRFGEVPARAMARLREGEPAQLARRALRVLEAGSLEEVFAISIGKSTSANIG